MKLSERTREFYRMTMRSPYAQAAWIPAVYVILAGLYIFFSGKIAGMIARDAEHLVIIESIKGFLFVIITGILLFILCYMWLKKLQIRNLLLIKNERRAIAGMTSASIAHDLNNLLMVLEGLLDELEYHEKENKFILSIRRGLKTSIDGLSHLSRSLVHAAEKMDTQSENEVDLSKIIPLIARLASKHPDLRRCTIKADKISVQTAVLNSSLLEQALLNLIINAAQAAGPEGVVEISAWKDKDEIIISVEDNGPGIKQGEAKTIFATGFTTKKSGSGLGLLCVRSFADSCSGTITVEKSALGGAAFLIHLPLKNPQRDSKEQG